MEATGKYDFAATAEDELSFRKGDIIKVCFNIYISSTHVLYVLYSTVSHIHRYTHALNSFSDSDTFRYFKPEFVYSSAAFSGLIITCYSVDFRHQ